jgi:hypothetical protein
MDYKSMIKEAQDYKSRAAWGFLTIENYIFYFNLLQLCKQICLVFLPALAASFHKAC